MQSKMHNMDTENMHSTNLQGTQQVSKGHYKEHTAQVSS